MRGAGPGLAACLAACLAAFLAISAAACSAPAARPLIPPSNSHVARVAAAEEAARQELAQLEHRTHRWPEDRAVYDEGVSSAWGFIDSHYLPSTGLVRPLGAYSVATVWDIASMVAAMYCARELTLLDPATYDARMSRLLETLGRVPLYDGRIFNRTYDTRTGDMLDRQGRVSTRGAGWSTTDLGRLLMWLKIVARDAPHAAAAERVVRRNDFAKAIRDGYLWGESVERDGRVNEFQEGRLGYEQYAATGFSLWGYPVQKALSLSENALPITILGEPLLADARRWDRLTNEPFLLLGLEAGWNPQVERLVRHMLRVQEARYRQTGVVTMPSEDAIEQPPYFFYYYCLYTNGKAFGVDVQDRWNVADGPRWVSAKSAFAFHALMPTGYTDLALRAVRGARSPRGWASGVYEGTSVSTRTVDINTAAVVMAAAVYERRGRAFLASPDRPQGVNHGN